MTTRRLVPFILLPLLLPALGSVAAERDPGAVRWEYLVAANAQGDGVLRVEVRILGANGVVQSLRFHPDDAIYPVRDFSGPTIRDEGGSKVLSIGSDVETFRFDVHVNRAAARAGEFQTYLGSSWGVVKGEALAIPFNFTFREGARPTWDARVTFALPPGWSASAPWARDGENRFRLPAGEALPRGFVALGDFEEQVGVAGGREVRTATLGKPLPYAPGLLSYLDASAPYFETRYGPVAGPALLVVSAPDPMVRGGLGGHDSFFVHEASDLRTAAHEHAHVWQQFAGVESATDSSVWLSEGDAEFAGTVSLFASGAWTLGEVNAFFAAIHAQRDEEPFRSTPLAQSGYGATERVAYGKGALVLAALDEAMLVNSQGRLGVPDLLAALNAAASSGKEPDVRVTNDEARRAVNRLTGLEFRPFFQDFVHQAKWPGWSPLRELGQLVVSNLTTEPAIPRAGERFVVRATIDNRGYAPATAEFALLLDGDASGARTATVAMGRRATVEFPLVAPREGVHEARLGASSLSFRVAAPARLAPVSLATIPARPAALFPADVLVEIENAGDFASDGTVVLFLNNGVVGSKNVTVAANGTTILAFPIVFPEDGMQRLTARVYAEDRFASANATLLVSAADRDGDGVPDAKDAYPENPALAEGGPVAAIRNLVPAGSVLAAVAAALLAAARRR